MTGERWVKPRGLKDLKSVVNQLTRQELKEVKGDFVPDQRKESELEFVQPNAGMFGFPLQKVWGYKQENVKKEQCLTWEPFPILSDMEKKIFLKYFKFESADK